MNFHIHGNGENIFKNFRIYENGENIFTNSKIYENGENIFMDFNDLNGLPYLSNIDVALISIEINSFMTAVPILFFIYFIFSLFYVDDKIEYNLVYLCNNS